MTISINTGHQLLKSLSNFLLLKRDFFLVIFYILKFIQMNNFFIKYFLHVHILRLNP